MVYKKNKTKIFPIRTSQGPPLVMSNPVDFRHFLVSSTDLFHRDLGRIYLNVQSFIKMSKELNGTFDNKIFHNADF